MYLFDEVGGTRRFISDSLNHYFELFCETINHLVTDGVITRSNMDRYNAFNRQPVMFAFSSPHGPCSIHLSCHHDKPFLVSCLDHCSVLRICMVCQGLFLRPIPEHIRPSVPQDCEVRRLFVVEGNNRIQNQQRHCASCGIEVIKTGRHKCGAIVKHGAPRHTGGSTSISVDGSCRTLLDMAPRRPTLREVARLLGSTARRFC